MTIDQNEHFQFWVQKVLPAVYDESLSYYELLAKVVDHLNKVTDQANETTTFTESEIEQLRLDFDVLRNETLPENVTATLETWLDNGKLEGIINDEVFENKADKEDVRESTALRPINISEFDTETRTAMTGGSVAVVGVNGVGQTNIVDKAINRDKTKYFEVASNNLVDEKTLISGGYYSPSGGGFVVDAGYRATDVIRVTAGDILKGNYSSIAFYDINYTVIPAPATVNGTKTAPTNTYYVRANYANAITYPTLAKVADTTTGTLVPPYEKVKYKDTQLKLTQDNVSPSVLWKPENLDIFESVRTVNEFDKNNTTLGRYNETGAYTYNGTVTSNYIPVVDGDVIRTKTTGYITMYDANKKFIGGVAPTNTFTVPTGQGVAFVRTTTFENELDTEMVVKNMDMPSAYVPYFRKTLLTQYGGGEASKLTGLSVNVMGTSLSETAWGGVRKYDTVLAEKYSWDLMNYGIGGTRIARATDRTEAFVDRYTLMRTGVDAVIVEGGTNDIGVGIPLGTVTSTDPTTFRGALNVLCDGLQTRYTGKPIGFIAPPLARGRNRDTQLSYVDAMIEQCNRHSIPVYDSTRNGQINPENTASWNSLFLPDDTVHLNDAGHEVWAKGIEGFLLDIL